MATTPEGLKRGQAADVIFRLNGLLYDVAGVTRDLEALYRGMWYERCAR